MVHKRKHRRGYHKATRQRGTEGEVEKEGEGEGEGEREREREREGECMYASVQVRWYQN